MVCCRNDPFCAVYCSKIEGSACPSFVTGFSEDHCIPIEDINSLVVTSNKHPNARKIFASEQRIPGASLAVEF